MGGGSGCFVCAQHVYLRFEKRKPDLRAFESSSHDVSLFEFERRREGGALTAAKDVT